MGDEARFAGQRVAIGGKARVMDVGGDGFARKQAGQVRRLLFRTAASGNRLSRQGERAEHRQRGNLCTRRFGDDRQLDQAQPCAASAFRNADPGQAEFMAEGAPQRRVDPVRRHRRAGAFAGGVFGKEGARRLADHRLFFGEDEMHYAVPQTLRGATRAASSC